MMTKAERRAYQRAWHKKHPGYSANWNRLSRTGMLDCRGYIPYQFGVPVGKEWRAIVKRYLGEGADARPA